MGLSQIPPEVFNALSELTGLATGPLQQAWLLVQSRQGGYRAFDIPRGDGRTRRIHEPLDPLREVQQGLLQSVLYRAPISPLAHGFVPGRSIVTNARAHLATAKAILSLDLENAFPSTSAQRLRAALEWGLGWFMRCSFPRLNKPARQEFFGVLTDLCCHEGRLPQGAPTSGMALNVACASLDRRCTLIVRRNPERIPDLRYTRYADDLTFTASAEIPGNFRDRVIHAIRHEGFRVNLRKEKHYTARNADLVICGVRLHNGNLTLPREVLRRYRALFFQALAYDPANVPPDVRDYLRGAIGFLTMVCPTCPPPLEEAFRALLRHHGAWLRAVRRSSPVANLLPYARTESDAEEPAAE
jgi:hypothetical protein